MVSECLCEYDDDDDDQNHGTDHTQDDHFLPERGEKVQSVSTAILND